MEFLDIVKRMEFLNIINVIFTAADIISDVVLAVDYCVTDNPWWCGLTWTFIAVPIIMFFFIFLFFSASQSAAQLKLWKYTEICFESGPQLMIQLYILALLDQDPASPGNDYIFFIILKTHWVLNRK